MLVCSKDGVETNGQTDGGTTDYFTFPSNAAGNYRTCVIQVQAR